MAKAALTKESFRDWLSGYHDTTKVGSGSEPPVSRFMVYYNVAKKPKWADKHSEKFLSLGLKHCTARRALLILDEIS